MGKLHPKVNEFKAFIENHPKLIKHVRKSNEGWQTYYDKWTLYGEDDDYWEQFKEKSEKGKSSKTKHQNQELLNKLSKIMNNVDINKLQEQVTQFNGFITNVQSLLQQFQQNQNGQQNGFSSHGRPNSFKFGKD